MPLGLRPFLVIAAVVAAFVLSFVVLLGHPSNEVDLLAWTGVALAAGLLVLVVPDRP
jgi:hypothetical protein